MTHEEIKRELSAYLDSELSPGISAEVEKHLAGCPECAREILTLKALSSGIKQNLRLSAPERLPDAVLKRPPAGQPRPRRFSPVLAAAMIFLLLLISSLIAAKRYMPGLLQGIQGMINGAAGTLGSSGNK